MKPIRVWIIEDNESDVYLISLALEKTALPLEITIIPDGEDAMGRLEACASFASPPPDLLLLDLHLPKTGGADILKAVQASQALARTCLAVTSSLPRLDDRIRLRPSDSYIPKAPDLNEFIGNIQTWVSRCTEKVA